MKNFKKALLLALLVVIGTVFVACSGEKKEVVIATLSSSYQDGRVLGGGSFKEEDTVTLLATANSGKSFVAWLKNNKIVSEESSYTFKATTNSAGTYTAVFKSENPTYLKPFAMAITAKSLKSEDVLTINSINFNFALGESTQTTLVTTQTDLDFAVFENTQISSVYDFESEYMYRLRSSYGEQTYTFTANLSYTLNQTQVNRLATKTLTLVNLEQKIDPFDTTYYQAKLNFNDANIEGEVYIWLLPAGFEVMGADIII